MSKEKREEDWHLSKTLNLSHLGSTLALLVGAVVYISALDTAIAVQDVQLVNLKDKMLDLKSDHEKAFDKINNKLDKMYEILREGPLREGNEH